MSGSYGLIELLLVFAIVLGFGLHQVRSLRRDSRKASPRPSETAKTIGRI